MMGALCLTVCHLVQRPDLIITFSDLRYQDRLTTGLRIQAQAKENPGHGPSVWFLSGRVSVGLVWTCGSNTTGCRVRGGGLTSAGGSLCLRESVVVAGAGSTGGTIDGGATGASSRAAAPPGSVAVLLPRTHIPGFGCRPVDPVGPWSSGVRANHSTSARHGCTARGQRGDIRGHLRDARSQVLRGLCTGVHAAGRESGVVAHPSRARCSLLGHG
jgi:hypothetical protein